MRAENPGAQALWKWVASAQRHLLLPHDNATNCSISQDNPYIWTFLWTFHVFKG